MHCQISGGVGHNNLSAIGCFAQVISGPELLTEAVGESEGTLRAAFAAARALAPTVLFLDEVDAIAPARDGMAGGGGTSGGDAAGAAGRVLATLLTEMEGSDFQPGCGPPCCFALFVRWSQVAGCKRSSDRCQRRVHAAQALVYTSSLHVAAMLSTAPLSATDPPHVPCRQVIVLAATNRIDSLDAALRRPGRFDRELEVPAPSALARRGILRARLAGMAHDVSEAEVHAVSDTLHGFVAADIVGLCTEAGLLALQRWVDTAEGAGAGAARDHDNIQEAGTAASAGCQGLAVTAADLRAAAAAVRPSGLREVAVEVPRVRFETSLCSAGLCLSCLTAGV